MKFFIKLFLLFIVVFAFSRPVKCSVADSITKSIDSIINNNSISDSIKIINLINKGGLLKNEQPELALQYYKSAEVLARKQDNLEILFKAIYDKGLFYYSIGDYKNTLTTFLETLKVTQQLNDSVKISAASMNLGIVYDELGDYKSSLDHLMKSLHIDEALNDSLGMATCYLNIGALCAKYEQNDKALEFFANAEAIANKNDIIDIKFFCYINTGLIYYDDGDNEKALLSYNKGADILYKLDDPELEIVLKNNIGLVYLQMNEYEKAEELFLEANKISTENLKVAVGITSGLNLAFIYLTLSEDASGKTKKEYLDKAFDYVKPTIEISKENDDHVNELFAYDILLKIYKQQDNYKMACDVQDLFIELLKEMNKTENNQELELLENKYKAEKQSIIIEKLEKENELKKLQHDNQTLYLIVSMIMFLASLVVVIVLYRMFKLKNINNKKLKEKNLRISRLVKELEASNIVKDKFFSIIAHDLKSPFNTLIGMSDLLKRSAEDLEITDIKEFATMINNASTDTFNLLTELLEWSRLQTKSIIAHPEIVDVFNKVEDNLKLYLNQAAEKGIKLENKVEKDIFVFVDPKMLNTILRNLVSNAIKFTAEGSISLLTKTSNSFVSITVSDTGTGISNNDIGKIFNADKMFTTKGTNSEVGTGLGLLLCKEMVELNGGEISVKSQEGEGTEFTFTLPIQKN